MSNAQAVAKCAEKNMPAILTPMEMLDRAISTGATPETLEKLLSLQERWEASQAKKAFHEAVAKAKAAFPTIVKHKEVKYSGNAGFKHETLVGMAKLIDPILTEHGLSYRFRTASDETSVSVTFILSHILGHSEENTLSGPHDKSGGKNSIQAVGSSVMYLQRYTFKAGLGLAAADDDDAAKVDTADAMEPITDEQATTLITEMDDAGADKQKFCEFFGIDGVALLPRGKLPEARAMIAAKKRKGTK
jgi:hypothetical protein